MSSPTTSAHTTFGGGVRAWRRARDLTQEQLGEAVGRSQPWVWKVEDGSLSPSVDDALLIARALGVRLADLLPPEDT